MYKILHVFIYIYTYSGPTKHIEPHESSFAQSRPWPPQECDQQPGYSMAKTCEKPSVQAEKYVSSLEGKIKEVQTLQLECNASSVAEHDASNFLGVQNCSNLLFPGAPASIFLYRTVSFLLACWCSSCIYHPLSPTTRETINIKPASGRFPKSGSTMRAAPDRHVKLMGN